MSFQLDGLPKMLCRCSRALSRSQTLSCMQLGQAALQACQQAASLISAVLASQFFVQWCTAVFAIMARLQARMLGAILVPCYKPGSS